MIREFTEQDRKLYTEMASEFYHSDAVLHPVPDEYFGKTADEARMRRSISWNATVNRRATV